MPPNTSIILKSHSDNALNRANFNLSIKLSNNSLSVIVFTSFLNIYFVPVYYVLDLTTLYLLLMYNQQVKV